MGWNGAGTYSPSGASFPEVNGTIIDAARFNATLTDVAAGITAALAKNGENVATANLPMGGFVHTGLGQASATGHTLAWGKNISVVDITSSGNTILGDALGDTLNVANGAFRVVASGDVGVNTASPNKLTANKALSINGAANSAFEVCAADTSCGWLFGSAARVTLETNGAIPLTLNVNGAERMRVMTTGSVVVKATSNAAIGGGTDDFAVNGTLGFLTQLNGNPGAGNALEIVNRNSGGIKLYTNSGGVVALTLATAGDATFSGGVTATSFTGNLTGNVTGNVTGSSASATGNAATATALQTARTIGGTSFNGTANIAIALAATATALATPRTIGGTAFDGTANIGVALAATATALATARAINGVNFDGTAPITVAAAAGTLTGATLAAGVTVSSLTAAGATLNLVGGAPGALTIGSGGNLYQTRFESAETACPSGTYTDTSVAHGNTRIPDLIQVVLRCKTAEAGFVANDEINLQNDVGDGAAQASQTYANVTTIGIQIVRSGANPPAIRHKTTGVLTTLTAANWKLVFRAHWL